MGINDRDYMKDSKGKSNASSQADVIDLNAILIILAKMVVVFVAVILCLRIVPLIWIKLPAAAVVGYFGWRWISAMKKTESAASIVADSFKRRRENGSRQKPQPAIERYKAAVDRSAKPDQSAVRLLVAYDAAGEFGRAKALIQSLDGEEFSESEGKELAALAKNYFPIELEPTETGVRFKLAKVE